MSLDSRFARFTRINRRGSHRLATRHSSRKGFQTIDSILHERCRKLFSCYYCDSSRRRRNQNEMVELGRQGDLVKAEQSRSGLQRLCGDVAHRYRLFQVRSFFDRFSEWPKKLSYLARIQASFTAERRYKLPRHALLRRADHDNGRLRFSHTYIDRRSSSHNRLCSSRDPLVRRFRRFHFDWRHRIDTGEVPRE